MADTLMEKKAEKTGPREGKPVLYLFHEEEVRVLELSGEQKFGRITKNNFPDLYSNSPIISRRHGVFSTSPEGVFFRDIGSSNGTTLNDRRIEPGKTVQIIDGSILRIHAVNSSRTDHDVVLAAVIQKQEDTRWTRIPLGEGVESIMVGRGQEISLRGHTASRKHASFIKAQNGWSIIDHHSLNGVYLNGNRIPAPVLLQPMDIIYIARHLFVFKGDYILFQEDQAPAPETKWEEKPRRRLAAPVPELLNAGSESAEKPEDYLDVRKGDIFDKNMQEDKPETEEGGDKTEKKNRKSAKEGKTLSIQIKERSVWSHLRKKVILKDVNLQVRSGSLLLILGGSGAGKTTFMNAVMGYEPAKGKILYGKADIYREFERMKYEIGYVPQQDLLRLEDVVYDTLENAARMRLPDSMSKQMLDQRVLYTLNMFGLSRERDTLVGKLSGGQRKRLSIAVEYIGNPALFFLDEPDSGLDGIMAKDLMMNLRQIADQGKIVMVISHAPDRAAELFDDIVVLGKSSQDNCGHLIYYGSPGDACRFFGTQTLEAIIGRINRKDEGGEGLADYYMQVYNSRHISR